MAATVLIRQPIAAGFFC
ncbi:SAM-dependent methyltransferase domain protein, partial [Vibrio cholerae HC-47A1]